MRKINPSDVRAGFVGDATALMAYMGRARRALEGHIHEKQDISRLASTTFLSLYVSFERFLSDLFLAYLNQDFSHYQNDLARRVSDSITSKFGGWANSRTRLESLKHVAVRDLEVIVDPDGRNLTFPDAATIKTKAQQWLAPQYSQRIDRMSPHDERLIDTARSIRDFIVHQSPGAKERMNAALLTVTNGPNNRYLSRGPNAIRDVGTYLKAVFDGHHRLAIYAERLQYIADKVERIAI